MSQWQQNPNWTDISNINQGNQFSAADGVTYTDMNSLVHNMQHLENRLSTVEMSNEDVAMNLANVGYVEGSSAKTWFAVNTNTSGRNTGYVEIPAGYKYIVANVKASAYLYVAIFFDSNKEPLYDPSVIGDGRTDDYIIEVPTNAKYVIISTWSDLTRTTAYFTNNPAGEGDGELAAKVDLLENRVSALEAQITDVPISMDIAGYVEGSSAKTWHNIATKAGTRSDYVTIDKTYKYVVAYVYANEWVFPILFFDSNKNAIYAPSVIGDKRISEPYTAEIPSNAAYVIVSEWRSTTNGITPKAYFTNNPAGEGEDDSEYEELEKRIEALENPNRDQLYAGSEFMLFRQWGIVGDSLSVGHTSDSDGNASSPHLYYSWGQYLARAIGNTCLNFGSSGVSAKTWMTNANGYNLLIQEDKLCQCYILALGANDANMTLGSMSDVDFVNMNNNADTEYGWYAKVINAIRTTAPLAPIFLFTLPYPRNTDNNIKAINNMIREFAANENLSMVYLVDLDANYNEYFAEGKLYNCIGNTGWHLTALGYLYAAQVNAVAISEVMAQNYEDFQNVFEIPYGEAKDDTVAISGETWTFELEDGTIVTKKVAIV